VRTVTWAPPSRWVTALLALGLAASPAGAPGPQDVPADVTFRVDAARAHPISRFIYGLNFLESRTWWGTGVPAGITLSRFGGNRLSAYNWETNDSNCGNDCGKSFPNDAYLVAEGDAGPGAGVRRRADAAFAKGAAFLVTVPVLGWVAADHAGSVAVPPAAEAPDRGRFRASLPRNPAGARAVPEVSDPFVYQDDFVRWLDATYPGARRDTVRPILYALDNEPDFWGSTHKEVRGRAPGGGDVLTGWDELVDRSISHAAAVKDVVPEAVVFGPGLGGWNGLVNLLHNATPDPATRRFCDQHRGSCTFLDYYLSRFREAGRREGRRLLDVVDVHWYPQGGASGNWMTNDYAVQDDAMIQARVQAPRSLWDPTFVERSWVARAVPGCASPGGCAIELLPRLARSIATHAPGTRIAISEYFYGRGGDISGAIAQADALGIFGREGVYAAALWPAGGVWAYNRPPHPCADQAACATHAYACIFAAFRAYLDHDGAGGRFGDTSLAASTTDTARTSVYASVDAASADRMVVVAINKAAVPLSAAVELVGARAFARAEVHRVTGGVGSCSGPSRVGDVALSGRNAFRTLLPAMSISVVVLRP
jgi:hypothetical protein